MLRLIYTAVGAAPSQELQLLVLSSAVMAPDRQPTPLTLMQEKNSARTLASDSDPPPPKPSYLCQADSQVTQVGNINLGPSKCVCDVSPIRALCVIPREKGCKGGQHPVLTLGLVSRDEVNVADLVTAWCRQQDWLTVT